ncbi:conserved Plasmodium protein, unknown function [Plasmodium ovale]|uniref:Uncharacterized protein n=1 Tax=Plasmodium ovale TaxID=36330 RepID=A0A1D3KXZ5_PLAOA|nr:conserved Plasmodium protein, unknown function [Plasmodium ovale]
MKDNLPRMRNNFMYCKKVEELAKKITILACGLSIYRKKYINFIKREKKKHRRKSGNKEILLQGNKNSLRKRSGRLLRDNDLVLFLGSTFLPIFKEYEELVQEMLYLCDRNTDVYIEFLYLLLIDSELFNNFLYICMYTSGDKDDLFLYLIYKHFLILIEYYYYFNNATYFNQLYYKLRGLYVNNQGNEGSYMGAQNSYMFLNRDKHLPHGQGLGKAPTTWDFTVNTSYRANFLYSYSSECSDFSLCESSQEILRTDGAGRVANEGEGRKEKKKNCKVYGRNSNTNHPGLAINEKSASQGVIDNDRAKCLTKGASKQGTKCEWKHREGAKRRTVLRHSFLDVGDGETNVKNTNRRRSTSVNEGKKKKNDCNDFSRVPYKQFHVSMFHQLENMFLLFEKLKYEHLYILLYFSLSVLPTLFHIYVTRMFSKKREDLHISFYLMYASKKIKENTVCSVLCCMQDMGIGKNISIPSTINREEKREKYNQKYVSKTSDQIRFSRTVLVRRSKGVEVHGDVAKPIGGSSSSGEKSNYNEMCKQNMHYNNLFFKKEVQREKKKKNISHFFHLKNDPIWEQINHVDVKGKMKKLIELVDEEEGDDYITMYRKKMSLLHTLDIESDFKKAHFEIVKGKKDLPDYVSPRKVSSERETISKEGNCMGNIKKEHIEKKQKGERKQSKEMNRSLYKSQYKEVHEAVLEALRKNLRRECIYKWYIREVRKRRNLKNCAGFHRLMKSLSIICNDEFYAFFMNNIDIKTGVKKNNSLLDITKSGYSDTKLCMKEQSDIVDCIHISSLSRDNTLIHNEYIKKKIKKNKIYTYKILNNQIETVLNSKELNEYIKKQKEGKRKREILHREKKKEDFLHIKTGNSYNILNSKYKIAYDNTLKHIQNRNLDVIESDCESYENSNSSDNITLYNHNIKYYFDNKYNIDYFIFFIVNSFYVFVHLHNVYFSSTYFNVLLFFSIKIAYKYGNTVNRSDIPRFPPKIGGDKHSVRRSDFAVKRSGRRRRLRIGCLRNRGQTGDTCNAKGNHCAQVADREGIKELYEFIMQRAKFMYTWGKRRRKGELTNSTSDHHHGQRVHRTRQSPYDNHNCRRNPFSRKGSEKRVVLNTFDVIINSFFDLCISLCSTDFNYLSEKRKRLNRAYFCDAIYFYHHIVNKQYGKKTLHHFNVNNYCNSVEAYLFYFHELRNASGAFARYFAKWEKKKKGKVVSQVDAQNGYRGKGKMANRKRYPVITKECPVDDVFFAKNGKGKLYGSRHLQEEKPLSKEVIFIGMRKKKKKKKKKTHFGYYLHGSDIDKSTTNQSDESFMFLKKMSRRIKRRVYIDEHNLINILISIGCLYMNNIKYNTSITLKIVHRMSELHGCITDRMKFSDYLDEAFCKEKNRQFSAIYDRYFISFFFFFKMHYLFFLMKCKCERDILLRAYWFLFAVFNITQG